MSHETKPVSFPADEHPDENQLLLALERELPAEDSAKVEQHLGNCWNCRARSEEIQRGILAFIEYREKRYLPSLKPPPNEYSGFQGQLRAVAGVRPLHKITVPENAERIAFNVICGILGLTPIWI